MLSVDIRQWSCPLGKVPLKDTFFITLEINHCSLLGIQYKCSLYCISFSGKLFLNNLEGNELEVRTNNI